MEDITGTGLTVVIKGLLIPPRRAGPILLMLMLLAGKLLANSAGKGGAGFSLDSQLVSTKAAAWTLVGARWVWVHWGSALFLAGT